MTIVITGGGAVDLYLRPAVAADRRRIEAMHEACSLDSRTSRWHAPLRAVPTRYLDDALTGRPGHVCVVATDGRAVLGFASAVRGFGDLWDLGVLVRDDVQRRGIGGRLLGCVIARARDRGAVSITADLKPGRRHLLTTLGRYGAVAARSDADGIHARVRLAAELAPPARPRSVTAT